MWINKVSFEELSSYKAKCENLRKTCDALTNKMNTPEWRAFEKSKVTKSFQKAKEYLVVNRKSIIRESHGLYIKYTIKDLEIESNWEDYNFQKADYYWHWKNEEQCYFADEYGEKLFQLACILYEPKSKGKIK